MIVLVGQYQQDSINNYNILIVLYYKQVLRENDGPWWISYDGTEDRCKSSVHNTIICNPDPLLIYSGGPTKVGKYKAEDHVAEITDITKYVLKINPRIGIKGTIMDNCKIMAKVQRILIDEGIVEEKLGCGLHGFHLLTGLFILIYNNNNNNNNI